MKSFTKFFSYSLAAISLLVSSKVFADICPPGANSTGLSISLTAFRSNSVTHTLSSVGGQVGACETIWLLTTLSYNDSGNDIGVTNAAFENGLVNITTPGGTTDVTPAGGIPEIGPVPSDCGSVTNKIASKYLTYNVMPADVIAGTITFNTAYTNGDADIDVDDLIGVESATTAIQIQVKAAPTCLVTPDSEQVCAGETAVFTVTPTGTGPFTYSWAGPNGFTATTNIITIPDAQAINAGTYTVTTTDKFGCTTACSGDLIVNPLPQPTIGGANPICPASVNNTYTAPAGMIAYAWGISGNGSIVGATNTQSITVNAGSLCGQNFTLQLTVANSNGCVGVTSTNVGVVDTAPPTISCPSNITIQCTDSTDPTNTGTASAGDGCSGLASLTYSDTVTPGQCPNAKTITRHWLATDNCDNTNGCDQIITVVDTIAPSITCPTNITIQCGSSINPTNTGTAMATDNCDDSPAISYTDGFVAGSCASGGTIIRHWLATDCSGNTNSCDQTITIVDTIAPIITTPTNITVNCDASLNPTNTGTATATDNCDATPTISYSDITTPGDCTGSMTVTRHWVATDCSSNSASGDQTITVVDTALVVIVVPTNVTIDCTASSDPTNTGTATATAGCRDIASINYSDIVSNGICAGDYIVTRTWVATDNCQNSTNGVQTITVQDMKNPLLTVPANVSVACNSFTPISSNEPVVLTAAEFNQLGTGYSVSDDCDDVTVTYWDSDPSGTCSLTFTRTFVATDSCSNSTTKTQIITDNCTCSTLFITDTMLCTLINNQFQLLYTPQTKTSCDKLNASTPGQYYLNEFYTGTPGSNATFTITLPYPWVTQGTQPIHAYDSVTTSTSGGQTCLTPGTTIYSNSKRVRLSNYSLQKFGGTYTFTLTVKVPASGFIYLNCHLDYGLKGPATSYGSNSAGDATQCGKTNVLIPNNQPYGFSVGGSSTNSTSVTSYNTFH